MQALMRPELAGIDVATMRGLEIGPLASPRVRKSEGPIRYLDHAGATELKQKYESDLGMRGRLDEIVDVDYVIGDKQTIADAVIADAPFDYVLASHVLEHIPDPIGWMDDIARILRPGGILSLVIPDKRYCFDINRSLTRISDLVDANMRHLRQPSYSQVYDFNANALLDLVDAHAVWRGDADYSTATRQGVGDPDVYALEACKRMQTSDAFVDVHCNVFTPDSFLDVFGKLARLGLTNFEVADFSPTAHDALEFYVSLRLIDATVSGDGLLQRQLASVGRARSLAQTRDPRHAPKPSGLVLIEVSGLEQRLLTAKRSTIAGMRRLLQRIR
ncbi:MAG TPA: methyltransferase domain-containing protein [Candidatus Dormibacteraeota bacterium]